MGVTAHFCADSLDGRLTIQSRLVAFRHVKGIHDGKNLAKIFVQILKELGVLNLLLLRLYQQTQIELRRWAW